jgi:hypothetical protein
MDSKVAKRFIELETQMKSVSATARVEYHEMFGKSEDVDGEAFLEWKVKAKNLIVKVCGDSSEHYKEFIAGETPGAFETSLDKFKRAKSIFLAAKEDFEGGYLTSVKTLVQSEVFETGLRELCSRESIPHAKLDKMNSDLTKKGVYNKLHQKRITALSDIRNSAAHGKLDQFTTEDVKMMIRDVEQFLANELDG